MTSEKAQSLSLERRVANSLNFHLTGGGCPTNGSLGECPAVYETYVRDDGVRYCYAHVYIWTAGKEKNLKATEVARWVEEAGGFVDTISHHLYDPGNFVTDGICEDGSLSWLVEFTDKQISFGDAP